jgi:prepilin peptidase CpaA
MDIRAAAALTTAMVAVICDVRTRRIPNVLTFGSTAAALAFSLADGGPRGVGLSMAGWLVGAALFFPMFALRGMGAGDVKLLAALAAWLGPVSAVWLGIYASIAGGLAAVLLALFSGYLRTAFANIWLMLMHWRVAGPRPVPGLTLGDAAAPRLAYAIPITMGVVCTLWLR